MRDRCAVKAGKPDPDNGSYLLGLISWVHGHLPTLHHLALLCEHVARISTTRKSGGRECSRHYNDRDKVRAFYVGLHC